MTRMRRGEDRRLGGLEAWRRYDGVGSGTPPDPSLGGMREPFGLLCISALCFGKNLVVSLHVCYLLLSKSML